MREANIVVVATSVQLSSTSASVSFPMILGSDVWCMCVVPSNTLLWQCVETDGVYDPRVMRLWNPGTFLRGCYRTTAHDGETCIHGFFAVCSRIDIVVIFSIWWETLADASSTLSVHFSPVYTFKNRKMLMWNDPSISVGGFLGR